MKRGSFVTFEGPEGSGKSTQSARLVKRLQEIGIEVLSTREPGGTPTGEMLRDILQNDKSGEGIVPETEVLLFAASRAQLVHNVILPALERGAWAVSDRFVDSTTAYQGYGRGFDIECILEINAFAIGLAVPDLTILLDVSVEDSLKRLRERNAERGQADDRFEREDAEFHGRVRDGYLALARRWPERFRFIDSSRDQDVVAADIWALVSELLEARK